MSRDTVFLESKVVAELNEHVHALESVVASQDTFLGASVDTVFTVLVTFIVFLGGIIANRWYKRNEERITQKRLRAYFVDQLNELLNNTLPKLIKAYENAYLINNTLDGGMTASPPKVLTNTYERIKNLESEELFYAIKNPERFNKIFSSVDFIHKLVVEVGVYHSSVRQEERSLREKLSPRVESYVSVLSGYQSELRRNSATSEEEKLVYFLSEKLNIYFNQLVGKTALTSFFEQIVRPVQKYLIDNKIYEGNPVAVEVLEKGKELTLLFSELKKVMEGVRLQYEEFANHLKTNYKMLVKMVDEI